MTEMETETSARRKPLSHKKYIPWSLPRKRSWDSIAGALRACSTVAQGHPLNKQQTWEMSSLLEHLDKYDRVVGYDKRNDRWMLLRRDPTVDDPSMPIRRP